LDAQVGNGQPTFRRDGDRYLVQLDVSVVVGPQYHVSAISADGGPLLPGKDLSSLFGMKVGDVPGRFPLEGLASQLRNYYHHYGYADVDVKTLPLLNREKASVAYRLEVIPGTVYHLRSLTVKNLNPEQEAKVKELLGIKPGDVYLDEAISNLYRKIAIEPLLKGLHFSFGPTKDKSASQVDLNLDFFKEGNESSVTIK
jgi:outer membrane protein assembly factor BamA